MTTENINVFGNEESLNQDEFYSKFKERLNEGMTFPSNYIYKFIMPANQSTIAMIHAIFENANASFSSRDSRNGKYTSLTITISAKDADTIINYYKEVASIKGVVML